MNDDKKTYVTTTQYYIAVKPGGEVVICRRDMHSGKETIMPLRVDLMDGKIYAIENMQINGGHSNE